MSPEDVTPGLSGVDESSVAGQSHPQTV